MDLLNLVSGPSVPTEGPDTKLSRLRFHFSKINHSSELDWPYLILKAF